MLCLVADKLATVWKAYDWYGHAVDLGKRGGHHVCFYLVSIAPLRKTSC